MIAHSLRKIHILGNREKTVQRLIYQGVNYFYGSKIMGSYLKKKKYFFLAAIREKHNFQYFENLTVKVCNIWCNDVYLYILCCDISW
jgi:hypothetical protein